MFYNRRVGQLVCGLVIGGLLFTPPMALQAEEDVNVYDFRSKKGVKATQRPQKARKKQIPPKKSDDAFVEVDTDLDQAGAELLAAEEALMQRIAAQTAKKSNANFEGDELLEEDGKEDPLRAALKREKEILAKLNGKEKPGAGDKKGKELNKKSAKLVRNNKAKKKDILKTTVDEGLYNKVKAEKASLEDRLKKQGESLAALQKSKEDLRGKIGKTESRIKELLNQLEEAQNKLMIAETEVERMANVIEARNLQNLKSHVAEASDPDKAVVQRASIKYGDKDIEPDMQIATIIVNKANLRTGPGLNNSPLMTVSKGTRLAIETRRGDWYRVIAPSGARAWVSSEVVNFGKYNHTSPTRTVKIKGYDSSIESQALQLIKNGR